jgi:hypothetical protein
LANFNAVTANVPYTRDSSGLHFRLVNGQSAFFSGLIDGNYTVSENGVPSTAVVIVDGEPTPTALKNVTLNTSTNPAQSLVFQNDFPSDLGALAVTKMVTNGTAAQLGALYDFTITPSSPLDLNSVSANVPFTTPGNTLRFSLRNGQTAFFSGLNYGSYTVSETNIPATATVSVDNTPGATKTVTLESTNDPAASVVFQNDFPTGSLTIEKEAVVFDGNSSPPTSSPRNNLTTVYKFQLTDAAFNPIDLSASGGSPFGIFTLKEGDSLTFDKLPLGDYIVSEFAANIASTDPLDTKYSRSYKVGSAATHTVGYTVKVSLTATNPDETVDFQNHFYQPLNAGVSLIVSKMATNITAAQAPAYYTFRLLGSNGAPVNLTGLLLNPSAEDTTQDLALGYFHLGNGSTAFFDGLTADVYKIVETPARYFDTYYLIGQAATLSQGKGTTVDLTGGTLGEFVEVVNEYNPPSRGGGGSPPPPEVVPPTPEVPPVTPPEETPPDEAPPAVTTEAPPPDFPGGKTGDTSGLLLYAVIGGIAAILGLGLVRARRRS